MSIHDGIERDFSPDERMPHDYEPPPRGHCSGCGCWVVAKEADAGIGWYEYWGTRCFDSRPYLECPECGLQVNEDCLTISPCCNCLHNADGECRAGQSNPEFWEGQPKGCPQFESSHDNA